MPCSGRKNPPVCSLHAGGWVCFGAVVEKQVVGKLDAIIQETITCRTLRQRISRSVRITLSSSKMGKFHRLNTKLYSYDYNVSFTT
jgi:hypothetical protein